MNYSHSYDSNLSTVILIIWFILLSNTPTHLWAQKWSTAQSFTSANKEAIGALATDAFQNTYLSGTFDSQLEVNGQTLSSNGFDDVFLSKIDPDGQVVWTLAGGGTNFDQVSALTVDDNDDVLWGGQFWIEGQFAGITLPLVHNSRGIYLLKYNSTGVLLWGRTIEGNGLKILTDVSTDDQHNIYLTGYFENDLILEDTTLSGNAFQSMFLLKLNQEGALLWAQSAGIEGEVRPQALALNQEGKIFLSGAYKGRVAFATDTIQTNTEDRDIFVAAYDSDGQALWGRKAGGVYDDECSALAIADTGNLYLTGTFLGVLKFSENMEIQTDGFNENFFLAAYTPEGTPLLAHSLGSTADETAHDILIEDDQVYLTGNYFGNLSIDPFTLSGKEDYFNGFLAAFDLDGQIEWLESFTSSSYVEGNFLASNGSARLMVAGNYSTDATFGYLPLNGAGSNDLFLAEINPLLSASVDPLSFTPGVDLQIFPNPSSGPTTFSWNSSGTQTPQYLQIYSPTGILIDNITIPEGQHTVVWQSTTIPKGTYFYQLKSKQQVLKQGKIILIP